jgi:hypothetical protein
MLLHPEDQRTIIVEVIDDSEDDQMAAVFATEDTVSSARFDGLWGSDRREGCWLIELRLRERGGGIERQWFTDNLHRELLEAILDVPHYVAVMPEELAAGAQTGEEILQRLAGALIFEVEDRSPLVAQVLAERDADQPAPVLHERAERSLRTRTAAPPRPTAHPARLTRRTSCVPAPAGAQSWTSRTPCLAGARSRVRGNRPSVARDFGGSSGEARFQRLCFAGRSGESNRSPPLFGALRLRYIV